MRRAFDRFREEYDDHPVPWASGRANGPLPADRNHPQQLEDARCDPASGRRPVPLTLEERHWSIQALDLPERNARI